MSSQATRFPAPSLMERALSRALDTVGDGTGVKSHVDNYASSAQIIRIKPPANKTFHIHKLVIHLDDNGSLGAGSYGAGSALAVGVKVSKKDSSDVDLIDLTNGNPIKTNGDWSLVCGEVTAQDWGGGDNMLSAVWSFSTPIVLRGYDADSFCVTLNDDFSSLSQHIFTAQGVEIGP